MYVSCVHTEIFDFEGNKKQFKENSSRNVATGGDQHNMSKTGSDKSPNKRSTIVANDLSSGEPRVKRKRDTWDDLEY